MSSKCIDLSNQLVQTRSKLTPAPIVKPNGELNIYAVDQYKNDFLEGIQEDSIFDPVQTAVGLYGDEFYNSLESLNKLLNSSQLSDYPELNQRYQSGPISAIEYADFIGSYNYTPPKIKKGGGAVLPNLNSYYRDSNGSILGGFCKMMPQAFAAIGGFFTIIGSVAGLINDALSFLTKLKNLEDPIKAIIEKVTVTSLIKAIKEKMTAVVEETWESVKSAVQNFDLEQTIGDIATYIDQHVVQKALKIKDEVTSILNDENKKGLTDKIKALFDYAVGLFANPSLEEIQFLIARFCALTSNIEALIKDVKRPMDNYAYKYQTIVGRLERISKLSTARAVSAGAVRIEPEKRKEQINKQVKQWTGPIETTYLDDRGNNTGIKRILGDFETDKQLNDLLSGTQDDQVTPTPRPRPELPDTVSVREGVVESNPTKHHTPTGKPPNNPPAATPKEVGDFPTWDEIKDGNHPRFKFTSGMGQRGWTDLSPDTKAALNKLQKKVGKKFTVNSGFRSEQYQNKLRERYKREGRDKGTFVQGRGWNYGVAFSSQHMLGNAVDVVYPSGVSRAQFQKDALASGFNWTKHYNSRGFMHMDLLERN